MRLLLRYHGGVIPKKTLPTELLKLIEIQHGVFSVGQCIGLGGSREVLRRHVRDGLCFRVAAGVYSVAPMPGWRGLAWGGLLVGGATAVLGGHAAGYLLGLCEQPSRIDVWTERCLADTVHWRFRRGARRGRGEPCRVAAEDAVLEMASMGGLDEAASMVLRAVQARKTTARRLADRMEELPNLRHRGHMSEALAMATAGAESLLEAKYLALVERAHGLPVAQRQVVASVGTRSDVAYSRFGVLVELDGRLGHEGDGAFRDAMRDNAHLLQGWLTVRFGWQDVVHDPCRVAVLVARLLSRQGWDGELRRCRRCPRKSK